MKKIFTFRRNSMLRFPIKLGLVNESSNDYFYAKTVDVNETAHMLKTSGSFWEAVEHDAKSFNISTESYMSTIKKNCKEFLDADEPYGREELMDGLKSAIEEKGSFVLLLGGKSVGKSSLIRAFAKSDRNVVLIDARDSGSDAAVGLVKYITEEYTNTDMLKTTEESLWNKYGTLFNRFVSFVFSSMSSSDNFRKVARDTPISIIQFYIATQNTKGIIPTIIIEESSVAFPSHDGQKEQSLALLRFFIKMTKQDKKLNVIITSSKYSELFRLADMGFATTNLTDIMYAGEVSPLKMRALLQDRWGLGHSLANMCLSHYGGHIWNTCQAIRKVGVCKKHFIPKQVLHPSIASGIAACIECERVGEADMGGMSNVLQQLATNGFVPVISVEHDKLAAKLSYYGIAGIVSIYATMIVGLPVDIWGPYNFALVPANNSVRLMISEALQLKS